MGWCWSAARSHALGRGLTKCGSPDKTPRLIDVKPTVEVNCQTKRNSLSGAIYDELPGQALSAAPQPSHPTNPGMVSAADSRQLIVGARRAFALP
jgi:hypothetical protein